MCGLPDQLCQTANDILAVSLLGTKATTGDDDFTILGSTAARKFD